MPFGDEIRIEVHPDAFLAHSPARGRHKRFSCPRRRAQSAIVHRRSVARNHDVAFQRRDELDQALMSFYAELVIVALSVSDRIFGLDSVEGRYGGSI